MKIDLKEILKTLGLPLGLIAVFAAILLLFGIDLDKVLAVAGTLTGVQMMLALTLDVLKITGWMKQGTAGIVSGWTNIVVLFSVALLMGFYPNFNFPALNEQIQALAKIFTLLFGLIVQALGTQSFHRFISRGLGLKASYAKAPKKE